ncbi:hypothetical protein PVL29_011723 [Vitis rotundifolia]|uniref:Retrovirus-related Pol polyprotein from transposon RE1 n=1 Tax=Vitis rotundifolia TaxID=103349 RepID=A0AA38ZQ77_VITRO|nr:hypothetical protein PVL29_011723 [Vitis rotundifolia]
MADHSTNVTPLQDSGEVPTAGTTSQMTNQSFPSLGQSLTIKLDRNNFLIWRNQMLNVVIASGFDDILDGTRPCPPHFLPDPNSTSATTFKSPVVNPEYITWQRQNRLVMSWIYSSLTESMMTQIMSYNTAHEIWKSLRQSFASASRAHIMELRLHLQTIRKGGLSMLDYMLRIRNICDNLTAVGELVSEQDQIMAILGGLGPEYNPFVVTITSRAEPISVEELQSHLMVFERQRSVEEQTLIQANAALFQQQKNRKKT